LYNELEYIKEYFDELVDGWTDYTARLRMYKEKLDGFLVEDPRDVEHKNLSGLLGLDQPQNGEEQGIESDFKLKSLSYGAIGAGEEHTDSNVMD
jgi:hypothetical protein